MTRLRAILCLVIGFTTAMALHFYNTSDLALGICIAVGATAMCAYGAIDFVEEHEREQAARAAAKAKHPSAQWFPTIINGGKTG